METETIYREPSDAANFFTKHVNALTPCIDQEPGKSFGIAAEGHSLLLLRDIAADSYSVGKKAFVVISHGTAGIEVQRLPDGCNVKLFYKHLQSSVEVDNGELKEAPSAIEEVKKKCIEYVQYGIEHAHKYDSSISEEMRSAKPFPIVSYAYIQRRLGAMAVIRNNGKSAMILSAVTDLVEMKKLIEVPFDIAKARFDKTAKLYEINF